MDDNGQYALKPGYSTQAEGRKNIHFILFAKNRKTARQEVQKLKGNFSTVKVFKLIWLLGENTFIFLGKQSALNKPSVGIILQLIFAVLLISLSLKHRLKKISFQE
ncbi:hypothetical protein CEXT_404881 [Caerostris extrusa]|uniref:Uncharacterized protein n=1 Tax=Caerostris extrusa TaxID=172846 RepID=A0AAV4NTY0_CAEEX|nr:hypothetical protein CEXT_404881 [Caerostris extrusa]